MIINRNGMKKTEAASGLNNQQLMDRAGKAVADFIMNTFPSAKSVLFLCGNGNNGGDGLVAADVLSKKMDVHVCLLYGEVKTEEAQHALKHLDENLLCDDITMAEHVDVIVDAVYGFGYHGVLDSYARSIFRKLNAYRDKTVSIDINSGCECDSGTCDRDALTSAYTCALECYKPFHMLRKEHHMFDQCVLLSLGLPHNIITPYHEMNEQIFFSSFPARNESDYKGTYGKTLIVSGSYGMAGALALNIYGARTVGTPYLMAAMHDCIYPILASKFTTPVFLPFHKENIYHVLTKAVAGAKVIACGSGWNNLDCKSDALEIILQNASGPVILDAEALRMLVSNTYLFRFVNVPLIVTPHIGEFSALIAKPVEYILSHREECALFFAKKYHVHVVLKGSNTIVVSPEGDVYINQSGCAALAQAGSGDLLTGMIAGILTYKANLFQGICMAVWLHGYLSEYGLRYHSMLDFPLECYPQLADELFKEHQM